MSLKTRLKGIKRRSLTLLLKLVHAPKPAKSVVPPPTVTPIKPAVNNVAQVEDVGTSKLSADATPDPADDTPQTGDDDHKSTRVLDNRRPLLVEHFLDLEPVIECQEAEEYSSTALGDRWTIPDDETAEDTDQPSIFQILPTEIVLQILEIIYMERPPSCRPFDRFSLETLKAFARTCRLAADMARVYIFRHIVMRNSSILTSMRARELAGSQRIIECVRSLRLEIQCPACFVFGRPGHIHLYWSLYPDRSLERFVQELHPLLLACRHRLTNIEFLLDCRENHVSPPLDGLRCGFLEILRDYDFPSLRSFGYCYLRQYLWYSRSFPPDDDSDYKGQLGPNKRYNELMEEKILWRNLSRMREKNITLKFAPLSNSYQWRLFSEIFLDPNSQHISFSGWDGDYQIQCPDEWPFRPKIYRLDPSTRSSLASIELKRLSIFVEGILRFIDSSHQLHTLILEDVTIPRARGSSEHLWLTLSSRIKAYGQRKPWRKLYIQSMSYNNGRELESLSDDERKRISQIFNEIYKLSLDRWGPYFKRYPFHNGLSTQPEHHV